LYPLTYVLHLAEELWGGEGFPAWVARVAGSPMPEHRFLLLNAIGLALMIAGVRLARRRGRGVGWIPIALAGIVLLNALAHIAATILVGGYSPGLFSALLLWMPLGIETLRRHRHDTSARDWRIGLAVSIAGHAAAIALAYAVI
jgi:hypothetical protein